MSLIKLHKNHDPALVVERSTASPQSAVYLLVANKPLKYGANGKSKIVYVGKTDRGMKRVHESAAAKAGTIFKTSTNPQGISGIVRLSAYTYSFAAPVNSQNWPWAPSVMLERAFLIRFKAKYGVPPISNDQRNAMMATVEFQYFNISAIDNVLNTFL
jgi:hypothetical protein